MPLLSRGILLFSAALSIGGPVAAIAQAAPSDSGPVLPSDSVKVALIRQLLARTSAVDQAIVTMETNLPAQRAANPRIPAVFWDRFMKAARASRNELETMVIIVYDRHFTSDEIRQLLAFYDTSIGRKLLEAQPAILQESAIAGQDWGRRIGIAVGAQLAAEGVRISP